MARTQSNMGVAACSQCLPVQDAKDGRDREYVEALRSTYLMHGKSQRRTRPIKKRVRLFVFRYAHTLCNAATSCALVEY